MSELSHQELEDWIRKVSTEFYEIVYQDDWLRDVFKIIPQDFITSQQVDFMLQAFGGPRRYSGRNPGDAHTHIFVNEEMWQHRENCLLVAFERTQCPQEIREKWLKIDNAFKKQIVMQSPSQCARRFTSDELIVVSNPKAKAA